jgi:uncharacterized protein (TIGR02246 family)
MNARIGARALLGALLAASFVPATTRAAPVDDALAVVERWAAAFTASDVDTITALYANDATFFGTSSTAPLTTNAAIRGYFERALLNNRPRSAKLDERLATELSDDTVVVTGLDTTTSVREGERVSTRGRVTFVLAKRGDEWRIVHFHRSALPL